MIVANRDIGVFAPPDAILAECPTWSSAESALYWIDIARGQLARSSPTGEPTIWQLPSRPGSIALRASGGLVVAAEHGFAAFDCDTGELTPIVDPEPGLKGNRFNDGACDRSGRFFAGSMDDAELAATGTLYRLDPDHSCHPVLSGLHVSNGIGWSPDGRTAYHIDSGTATITAYDYESVAGKLGSTRWKFHLDRGGAPDGLAVDADGSLWVAVWDGGRIIRLTADGNLDTIMPLPVPRPTSCTFGGDDLRTLFVTSARIGLSDDVVSRHPLSGAVLAVEMEVPGLPLSTFAG